MSKTRRRFWASRSVSRSGSSVAHPASCRTWATYWLRGLKRPLPLPCAKITSPRACSATPRMADRVTVSVEMATSRSFRGAGAPRAIVLHLESESHKRRGTTCARVPARDLPPSLFGEVHANCSGRGRVFSGSMWRGALHIVPRDGAFEGGSFGGNRRLSAEGREPVRVSSAPKRAVVCRDAVPTAGRQPPLAGRLAASPVLPGVLSTLSRGRHASAPGQGHARRPENRHYDPRVRRMVAPSASTVRLGCRRRVLAGRTIRLVRSRVACSDRLE